MPTLLSLPKPYSTLLLQDAQQRDLVTARRSALLGILLDERYLTREQLISRVELILGKNCFGSKAWDDNFFRDMRFVKLAFSLEGYELKYSRRSDLRGYYLKDQPRLDKRLRAAIGGALAELDDQQISAYQRLTAAEKFRQASSMIDLGRKVARANQ